jgi:hypothetical protein
VLSIIRCQVAEALRQLGHLKDQLGDAADVAAGVAAEVSTKLATICQLATAINEPNLFLLAGPKPPSH